MPFTFNANAVQAPEANTAPQGAPSDTSQQPQTVTGVGSFNPNAPALSPTAQQSFGQALTYGLPGMGVGLIDTLGQSIGVLHNNTIPDALKNVTGGGEGSFGDFYSRNQQPLRTGGELAGMFLPGLVAMKALKSVRLAREAVTLGEMVNSGKIGASLDMLLGNSADLTALETNVSKAAYSGAADSQGVWAGRTVLTPELMKAKSAYYAAKAIDSIRTTAAFELGNRIAFNSSSTFYPADYTLTDQLKWNVAGFGVGLGIEMAATKYVTRNLIKAAVASANLEGAVEKNVGPLARYAPDLTFSAGNRGVGVSVLAGMKQDLKQSAQINVNPQFQTNVASDQTNIGLTIKTQLNNMAADAHPFLPRTTLDDGQIALANKALDKDSTAFLYGTKLAQLPDMSAGDFYKGIADQVGVAQKKLDTAKLLAGGIGDPNKAATLLQTAQSEFNQIDEAAHQLHYVIEGDGSWSVFRDRAPNWLDDNSLGDIKRKTYTTPEFDGNGLKVTLRNSKLISPGDNPITLHDNFRAELPKNPTPMDISTLYAMGSKMIQDYKPVEGQVFRLTPQVNWRTLEGTVALADANKQASSAIQLGGGFNELTDVKFEVLNQKFQQFNSMMDQTSKEPLTGVAAGLAARMKGGKPNYSPAEVMQMLNLPAPVGQTPSPVIEMFAHAKLQGMTDLNDMFPAAETTLGQTPEYSQWDLLQQHLRETVGVDDPKIEIPTQGGLLKQSDARPFMVAANSAPLNSRADTMIGARVQALRDIQLQRLGSIDPKTSPLVAGSIAKILTPDTQVARTAVTPAAQGLAPSTGINPGAELPASAQTARMVQTLQDDMVGSGQVTYQDRVNEAFPALKAMQLISQNGDTFTRNYFETLAKQVKLQDQVSTLLNPRSRADLLDFNRIEQAYRHGWDIKALEPSPTGDGYVFRLNENSAQNKNLSEFHFPTAEDDGSEGLMPDMSVTALKQGRRPLVVSKAAGDLAKTISSLSIQSGRENNALRMALGKTPVQLRDFHLPTPELSSENTWFVRNDTGRVVATYGDGTYNGNRQRAQAAAAALSESSTAQHIAVPVDSVARDHQLLDDNFFDLIDYSDQLAKTNKGITGGLAKREIDTGPQTLTNMATSLQSQYLNIGIRSRLAVFEPELNYARQASVAGQAGRENIGKANIFDRYIATASSRNPSAGQGIAKIYTASESWLDQQLSWMQTKYATIASNDTPGNKLLRAVLFKQTPENEYNQFKDKLEDWNPLKNAQDWAESTFRQSGQLRTRNVTAGLTRLATTMSLRVMDLGTVVMEYGGLVTNLPSTITALRRMPGESDELWHGRTAAWSSEMTGGIKTFSPAKAAITAMSALWDPKMVPVLEDAAQHGYFQPEYASLARSLQVPASSWSGKAFEQFSNAATYIVDHTEIHQRQVTWTMGYKIAKELHMMQDDRNAYIFANNFVNDTIGNYSGNNKPAIFTGALGVPLGAFQTYMANVYRRLYGMVERKDVAGLIAQYAAQASVYGAQSTPGYALWNSMFQTNDIGSDDFGGRVNRQLPPGMGELVLHGTLSNIPKIWGGMQASGLNFYTRGGLDVTDSAQNFLASPFRTPMDLTRTPPATFLAHVANGIDRTIKNVFSSEGFSVEQQEDILATMSTNRAFKSIMEMAANVKTDDRGNVIEYGTRDAIHVAAGLLGAQPSYVAAMQQATAKNRNVQLQQEALRSDLNDRTRALFRSGQFGIDNLQGMVNDYVKSGGNPAYLGQWMRNSFAASMTPKAQQQLNELARSGKLLQFQDMLATLQQNQKPGGK